MTEPRVVDGSGRREFLRTALAIPFAALAQPRGRATTGVTDVAVIVHRDNALTDVSHGQIERIFRLRQQRWSNGQRIYLVMQEEGSRAKEIVLEKIYGMTSDELKRFWLAKIYRGEMTSFPKTFSSDASMLRFVSRAPNAIGYVDANRVDASVKTLRIDGRRPGADGYFLTDDGGDR